MSSRRIISVITPVYAGAGAGDYLGETYRSLIAQELPDGWEWEWCLQEDGDTGIPRESLPPAARRDPRVSYGVGMPGRASVSRTMALGRARGRAARCLDADDVLLPGALARDIACLHRVAWCVSAGLDLLPDGSTRPGPCDPPAGPLEAGLLFRQQEENRLSVMAQTFAAHTDLIWALGGWTALTGAETIGLLLAADAVAPGEFIAQPSMLYRKHPGQTTASARYWNADEQHTRLAFVLRRARALRARGWRWAMSPWDEPAEPSDEGVWFAGRQTAEHR